MELEKRGKEAGSRGADKIYNALVEAILSGELAPGDRLDEGGLAARFGVSRTPVREALQALALAGLAVRGARRAFVVSALDGEALMQLFEALAEIESIAARYAALRLSRVQREELRELLAEGDRLARQGDGRAYASLNLRFHQVIYEGAQNPFLAELAQQLRVRTAPYRKAQLTVGERLAASQSEHRKLFQAFEARDAEAAAEVMQAHIATAGRKVLSLLAQRTEGSGA